ncbi:UNVERIFIED_CONTAM: hypothetical protein Sangu_1080000 [Sesamum angustifolium]|uniref:Uncharacterized protein n=1 Tax=Sesamum angustifolium TaxID=2727405 RepID=A0AAW2P034_9LAMI
MAEEKLSPRRESKLILRAARYQKAVNLEAIAQLSGENGLRMKIVVKKEDLKQVVEAIRMRECRGGVRRAPAATSLEQRLNWMRRRQIMRGRSRVGPWRPVLQSIPEEV